MSLNRSHRTLISILIGIAGTLVAEVNLTAATLRVIATTPDLASIARSVGGDKVQVESLAKGVQNPHFVDAKPSLIVKVMKADLFMQTGLELEIGWAPLLVQSSGNKNVQPGSRGFLDSSSAIRPIEVPQNPSRLMGDVHPGGNPHYLADPENGKLVARAISERLSELSPENRETFAKNLKVFTDQTDARLKEWKAVLAPHAGAKFVSYHRVYPYFAERFGLAAAGEIEPKPGIPPTAGHNAELIARMKAEKIALILTDPWFERRTADSIAQQTGAAVITMALMPGGVPEAAEYLDAIDYNVRSIAKALASGKK